jgi:TolB-like protein
VVNAPGDALLADFPSATTSATDARQPMPGQTVSIAVMPFENLSGSLEHDYFSLGFVEDLITDLAHFANLQVISSHSSTQKKAGITSMGPGRI